MTKSLEIYAAVFVLSLIQRFEGKVVQQDSNQLDEAERVKRGYSKYGENDFGTSFQVSSGVLQYSMPEEHSSIDVSNSYDHGAWQPSSPSSSFDLWLDPSPNYQPSSDVSSHSLASSLSSGGEHQLSSSVLSTDSHLSQIEIPHSGGLHTQISASSGIEDGGHISSLGVGVGAGGIDIGHHQGNVDVAHISDNVDFNNIADLNSKHYAKSYGK